MRFPTIERCLPKSDDIGRADPETDQPFYKYGMKIYGIGIANPDFIDIRDSEIPKMRYSDEDSFAFGYYDVNPARTYAGNPKKIYEDPKLVEQINLYYGKPQGIKFFMTGFGNRFKTHQCIEQVLEESGISTYTKRDMLKGIGSSLKGRIWTKSKCISFWTPPTGRDVEMLIEDIRNTLEKLGCPIEGNLYDYTIAMQKTKGRVKMSKEAITYGVREFIENDTVISWVSDDRIDSIYNDKMYSSFFK